MLSLARERNPGVEVFDCGPKISFSRFFADAGLYLDILQLLGVFNISDAVDKKGKEIEVDFTPKPGILTYPDEFKCRVSIREKHSDLIRHE